MFYAATQQTPEKKPYPHSLRLERVFYCSLFFAFLLFASPSHASLKQLYQGRYLSEGPIELGNVMEILADPTGTESIRQLINGDFDTDFVPHERLSFNPGFSERAF